MKAAASDGQIVASKRHVEVFILLEEVREVMIARLEVASMKTEARRGEKVKDTSTAPKQSVPYCEDTDHDVVSTPKSST